MGNQAPQSCSGESAGTEYSPEWPQIVPQQLSQSLHSIEGSQAKMSTARRFQGARSRRYSVSAMQRCEASAFRVRNAESGVQGHLQRPERSEEVLLGCRFCLNTGSHTLTLTAL